MILSEILDTSTPLQSTKETDKVWTAQGKFGDREIEFKFAKWPEPNIGRWNFTFTELGDEHEDGETFDATGKGNEFAIFATAKKFLEQAIAKYKPMVVYFEADKSTGDARASLYKRFTKRWVPNGYKHRIVHSEKGTDYHAYIENELYKKTYKDEDDQQ